MATPQRIQLSRRRGFRLQEVSMALNGLPAVKCARPGPFGNPFKAASAVETGYAKDEAEGRLLSISAFRDWLRGSGEWWSDFMEKDPKRIAMLEALPSLRGKNLACFCKPGPCHCDVLLELANA
jgi:hypothetical protein